MNWQAINFDWNQVRAFLATAEEGSLSAAARVLKTTQPTIGRQVSALEEALAVTLFERHRRGLILTTAGRELLTHVRDMGEAAGRVSLAAAGQSDEITGEVSVTAVDVFAGHYLIPVLQRLREEAPGLKIRINVTNTVQDIARREADIALRHLRPTQPDLVARLVATHRAYFFATSAYLDQVGRPRSVHDLSRYDIIGVDDVARFMSIAESHDLPLVPEQFTVSTDSGQFTWDMLRAGLGMALMDAEIAESDARLENVWPAMRPIEFPVWLTTHRELQTSRRIRLVFDTLGEALSPRTAFAR